MPIYCKIERKDGQRTAVWEILEDENTLLRIVTLNTSDKNTFSQITNPGRRLEWLAIRALLKEFYPSLPSIDYHENGRPLLVNHRDKISISHSGKLVAIALHPVKNPGIDIEITHPRILKISTRFLNEHEKKYLGDQPTIEQLTIIWGAKEVMFKVYEHGDISFKNDFTVKSFTPSSNGNIEGIIYKNTQTIHIPMEYRKIGNFILVQTNYSYSKFEKNPNFDTL